MSLSIGIVGLPNVGKSTLFKALTKKQVDIQNYPFCTIDPNVGVVAVPDERVDRLAEFSHSKKKVPTAIEFVDIAGLIKGASEGEGLGNKFLSHIREVDAIAEIVRVFKNDKIIHVHNEIDPQNDVSVIEAELILADLETLTKRLGTIEREIRAGEKDAKLKSEVMARVKESLSRGVPARDVALTKEETLLMRDLHLLTMKPVLFVCNVSKNNTEIPEVIKSKNHVLVDIKSEEDLMELSQEESAMMRKDFEIIGGLDELIRESYKMLGLVTFFTTGEDPARTERDSARSGGETRAWTIPLNSTAPEAGTAIHTDFKEKFIRADVINWQKLIDAGSYAKAREQGLLRTEGKDYIVKDGDVIEFKI